MNHTVIWFHGIFFKWEWIFAFSTLCVHPNAGQEQHAPSSQWPDPFGKLFLWCLWEIPYLFYGRLWYYLLLIWYLITNLRRKEGWLEFLTWFCDDLKHDANEDTSTDVDKKEVEIWDGNVLTWIVWRRAEWLMFFSLIAFHFNLRHI